MNDLLLTVSRAGGALTTWFLPTLAWTTAVLAAAVLADRALGKRARASLRIALYAAVFVRAAVPVGWRLPVAAVAAPVLLPLSGSDPLPSVTRALRAAGDSIVHVQVAIAVGWILGAAVLLAAWVRARREVERAAASASPRRLPDARGSVVYVHDAMGPMVVGVLRPRIVLPAHLLESLDAAGLGRVLRHEQAHIARRDPLLAGLMQLVVIAAWPLLPLWIAARQVRRLMELSCDEAALSGADDAERRRYGETLLSMAEQAGPSAQPMALGFGSDLRARIGALRARRRWPVGVQRVVVLGLLGGTVACSTARPQASWAPPSALPEAGGARTRAILLACAPLVFGDDAAVAQAPREQRDFCAKDAEELKERFIREEAIDALRQMAADIAAAYETKAPGTTSAGLCPTAGVVPAALQKQGAQYQPTAKDWTDPGWSCMRFSMDNPIWFQYEIKVDPATQSFEAFARRAVRGKIVEWSLKGAVAESAKGKAVLRAPDLELRWLDAR